MHFDSNVRSQILRPPFDGKDFVDGVGASFGYLLIGFVLLRFYREFRAWLHRRLAGGDVPNKKRVGAAMVEFKKS